MINKEIDELHSGLDSPIPRLPNKPCLPRVKINNDASYVKKTYLNKPFNRQAIVGFRATASSHNNYLSQVKANTKSYLTNFSSLYSPLRNNKSANLLSNEGQYKKPTSTFLESNTGNSILSNDSQKIKSNVLKGESTAALLRNKFISRTIIKNNELTEKDYAIKSNKFKRQRKSKMIQYQERMNQKIRKEYNIKEKSRENKKEQPSSNVASFVYGERMFMSKYKSHPKFMETLNSTLSPRKDSKTCITHSSVSSSQHMPYGISSSLK